MNKSVNVSKHYSNEIKEYAKKLYLSVDESGNRLYTLSSIADKIKAELGVKISRHTIHSWAVKYKWDLEEKIINKAILKEDEKSLEFKNKINKLLEEQKTDEEILNSLVEIKRNLIIDMLETSNNLKEVINKHLKQNKLDYKISRYVEVYSTLNKELSSIIDSITIDNVETNQNATIIINEINTKELSNE